MRGLFNVLSLGLDILAAGVLGFCLIVKAVDEERYLLRVQGEYVCYSRGVGCFLPKLWKFILK